MTGPGPGAGAVLPGGARPGPAQGCAQCAPPVRTAASTAGWRRRRRSRSAAGCRWRSSGPVASRHLPDCGFTSVLPVPLLPDLGAGAVAVVELHLGAVGGAGRGDVHALAEGPERAAGADGPVLRGGAVAVVELDRGAVGAAGRGDVDALAAVTGWIGPPAAGRRRGGAAAGDGVEDAGELVGALRGAAAAVGRAAVGGAGLVAAERPERQLLDAVGLPRSSPASRRSPVVKTSLVVSFTPIIGVLPSIAHSWAEVLVVQIWPSWVCRPCAALMAALPMSIAGRSPSS